MDRHLLSYLMLLGLSLLFLLGCSGRNNHTSNDCDSIVIEDEFTNKYISTDDPSNMHVNDSTMIGAIFLGMSRQDFNRVKSEFLKENPTLSNLKIANMQGYFYEDKLVRVVIVSDSHLNWHGGMQEDNICSEWTDLYKQKYTIYSGGEITPEVSGATVFSKGHSLIIVTDEEAINDIPNAWDNDVLLGLEDLDSNPLMLKRLSTQAKEAEALSNRTPGTRFSVKRFSRIDIIDRNLFISTENERSNERRKRKEVKSKNELDLI